MGLLIVVLLVFAAGVIWMLYEAHTAPFMDNAGHILPPKDQRPDRPHDKDQDQDAA
jgi:hypothetical protein